MDGQGHTTRAASRTSPAACHAGWDRRWWRRGDDERRRNRLAQALHLSWIGTTRRCRRCPDSQVKRSRPPSQARGPSGIVGLSSLVTVARTVSDLHRLPGSASPTRVYPPITNPCSRRRRRRPTGRRSRADEPSRPQPALYPCRPAIVPVLCGWPGFGDNRAPNRRLARSHPSARRRPSGRAVCHVRDRQFVGEAGRELPLAGAALAPSAGSTAPTHGDKRESCLPGQAV
jgi:hypothetical protein